jgi:hypothetical protein
MKQTPVAAPYIQAFEQSGGWRCQRNIESPRGWYDSTEPDTLCRGIRCLDG